MEEIRKITIPEFKELPQWLVWNYEYDEETGKKTKVPKYYKNKKINIGTGEKSREKWTTFENVETAKSKHGFDGIRICI